MDELETLKKEKSDTEEARKITEAHIESMKKDHEEKVFDTFLLLFYISFFIFRLHLLRFKTTRDAVEAQTCLSPCTCTQALNTFNKTFVHV